MEILLLFLGTESICKRRFLNNYLPSATSTPLFLDKRLKQINTSLTILLALEYKQSSWLWGGVTFFFCSFMVSL